MLKKNTGVFFHNLEVRNSQNVTQSKKTTENLDTSYFTEIKNICMGQFTKESEKSNCTQNLALCKVFSGRKDTQRKIWIQRATFSLVFKKSLVFLGCFKVYASSMKE